MPSYDYKCGSCENRVTIVAGIKKDHQVPVCVNCKSPMRREYASPPVKFIGKDFYSTS